MYAIVETGGKQYQMEEGRYLKVELLDGDVDSKVVFDKIVNALKDIPVRMISYGGSNYNVSFLVQASDKKRALNLLSEHLFN